MCLYVSPWLVWKVNSSTLRWYNICWGIIWSWPIIWARKWPLRQKSRFRALFCQILRKLIEIYKLLQWAAIRKMGLGFLTTPKLATQLDPFPLFRGWKHGTYRKNWLFHFQMMKLCCEVFPNNNFQRQSCSCTCSADNCQGIFETDAYLRILQWFRCTPSIDAAISTQWLHWCACAI